MEEKQTISIAKNVDERGVQQIRSLIGRYGLSSFLEAVFLELHDIISNPDPEDADFQEAKRVYNRLDKIIGWQKETRKTT